MSDEQLRWLRDRPRRCRKLCRRRGRLCGCWCCGRRRRFVRRPHAGAVGVGMRARRTGPAGAGLGSRHLALAGRAKRCRLAGHFRCRCHRGRRSHRRDRRPTCRYAHRPERRGTHRCSRRAHAHLAVWAHGVAGAAAWQHGARNYFRAPAIGSALVAGRTRTRRRRPRGRYRQVQQLSRRDLQLQRIQDAHAAVRIDRHTLRTRRLCLAIVEAETHAVLIVRGVPDRGRSGGASWRYLVLLASAWSDALAPIVAPRPELRSCRAAPRQTALRPITVEVIAGNGTGRARVGQPYAVGHQGRLIGTELA
jgi:hypothetical protein